MTMTVKYFLFIFETICQKIEIIYTIIMHNYLNEYQPTKSYQEDTGIDDNREWEDFTMLCHVLRKNFYCCLCCYFVCWFILHRDLVNQWIVILHFYLSSFKSLRTMVICERRCILCSQKTRMTRVNLIYREGSLVFF